MIAKANSLKIQHRMVANSFYLLHRRYHSISYFRRMLLGADNGSYGKGALRFVIEELGAIFE
jgi:hypothetical protein